MTFAKKGFIVRRLHQRGQSIVRDGVAELESRLGPLTEIGDITVEQHAQAAEVVQNVPREVIRSELDCFRWLLGADLQIQRRPFLRIARPQVRDDNIGMHRDTWYGDTPYEISIWIPFVDTDDENALRVAPGSHLWSEEEHPVERFDGSVEPGSVKHSLGFIAGQPKRLAKPAETIALPVRVGTMIIFSLALLHGQEVNRSTRTRVSMDVRLTNALSPVRMARSRDPNYYEPLCTSPVTEAARLYYEAQKAA